LSNISANRINKLFNNKRLRSFFLKLRYPLFICLAVVLIKHIKPSFFLAGFIISMAGELIQLWCFASLDKNKTLSIKGPYILVRNPMYLGRFFLLLGCIILVGNLWLASGYTILYYFYMANRVKREEKKLKPLFGEDFEKYCHTVNRFLPSFKGIDIKALWFFKWRLFFKNNGHWNLAGLLAAFALFYFFTFIY